MSGRAQPVARLDREKHRQVSFTFATRPPGRGANAELSGPEGPLEQLVFRMTTRNCAALGRASRTSRSSGRPQSE